MGKIYCLIGKSAVGKSTIERLLEQMGHKRIISYTTRPIRENEVNGVDYYFVTSEEFIQMNNSNEMLESQVYREWYYGIKNDIDLEHNSYVLVIEPKGYEEIKEKLGKEKVVPLYIYVNDLELMRRAINRATKSSDVEEIIRRFQSDKELFDEFEYECSYKFNNIHADETAHWVDNLIKHYN